MPFAAYPAPFVFDKKNGTKKIQQCIWGDTIEALGPEEDGWVPVNARLDQGWMRAADLQEDCILEVVFVDIGQGDGCFIVTPRNKLILVDAGLGNNMVRFLRWRFDLRSNPDKVVRFESGVITHPDEDHYGGFDPILKRNFEFGALYHNGVVERKGPDRLGPKVGPTGEKRLTDIIVDEAALATIIDDPAKVGEMKYPNLLKLARDEAEIPKIRMLSARDEHLPGYGPSAQMTIEVLGPVPEEQADGSLRLRWKSSDGITKNGNSVILMFRYGKLRMLIGGDLNRPFEELLLEHYTGLDSRPTSEEDRLALAIESRKRFRADVAKACHHGSADFTSRFLEGIDAIATVVSSGDEESHCHPRPDALGALGRRGRGERPLIFSTELARSSRETIETPQAIKDKVSELLELRDQATDEAMKKTLREKIQAALSRVERSVAVYGAINLRTDGDKALIAQKLERPRPNGEKWDYHLLEADESGELRYVGEE
ncbi:MAG: ComEC/Rec2 family competence protein [Gemmatimonadota bacterium]